MYFITNYEELKGRTIGFIHMARFANPAVIGTTDGGILMIEFEYEEDDFNEGMTIRIVNEMRAEYLLSKRKENDWMLKDLVINGVIKPGEFEEIQRKRKEDYEKMQEETRIKQEEQEHQDYIRLKEKYENK